MEKDTLGYLISKENKKNISTGRGYYTIDSINKNIQYVIVYPGGLIEFFTKRELEDYIKNWDPVIDEDAKIPYIDLLNIKRPGEWTVLSGPVDDDEAALPRTIGYRYR